MALAVEAGSLGHLAKVGRLPELQVGSEDETASGSSESHPMDPRSESSCFDLLTRMPSAESLGKAPTASDLDRKDFDGKNLDLGVSNLPGVSSFQTRLWKGHFAEVWATQIEGLGAVAVKLFKVPVNTRSELLELSGISHPNLVQILRICEVDHNTAIVMELCGTTLEEALHCKSGLPNHVMDKTSQRISVCLGICDGLDYLHSKQLMHRSLAAKHCFVSRDANASLGSTGTSVKLGGLMTTRRQTEFGEHLTKWIGDFSYMSPEEMEDDDECPISTVSDIFSFGILLHECATRSKPYSHLGAIDGVRLALAVSRGERPEVDAVPSLNGENKGTRDDLINLMKKCWVEDPADRPDITCVRADLKPICEQWTMLEST